MRSRQLSRNIRQGLRQRHCRPVQAYGDRQTVKLDFDNTKLKTVKYWAYRTQEYFRLKGHIILQSSRNNYHVLFDRSVSWTKNLHIVAWVAQQTKNKNLTGWLLFQCIKESSTLRVGMKGRKHPPKIIFRHGSQAGEIRNYLTYRRLILGIEEKVRCMV